MLLLTLALIALTAVFSAVGRAASTTFTVTTTADSGAGSLRQAILDANANAGTDTIEFNLSGSAPFTIAPTSELPTITDAATIDGTTQPGFSGTPIVELDGSNAGVGAVGLSISAGSSTVRGLIINHFSAVGIYVFLNGGAAIEGNYIGTNAAGTAAAPNGDGILVQASDNTIGGPTAAARNLISGNSGYGVWIRGVNDTAVGSAGNRIEGNYIGTNAAGTAAVPNGSSGIEVSVGEGGNTIGGTLAGARNVISGNAADGLSIEGSDGNTVRGNYIGTGASGTGAIPNNGGVMIRFGAGNTIGGTVSGARNVISGNTGDGLQIVRSSSANNFVGGNYIGTDATGTADLGNGFAGVTIAFDAHDNVVGGATAGARNVISGNDVRGVVLTVSVTGNSVQGNYIGTDASGAAALGNSGAPGADSGVVIAGSATGNTIGGSAAGEGNVISANLRGVRIENSGTTGNLVEGNLIGTNAAGTASLGNTIGGVWILGGASDNTVGGTASGAGNTIAFNAGKGVAISAGTGNAVLSNSIFSNTELGIDLDFDGVTGNDAGDADAGTNNRQNFPVVSAAVSSGGSTVVSGTLDSRASTSYRLEFFANAACDASGNGEGETLLGYQDVVTDDNGDGSGDASFTATLSTAAPSGSYITATATDGDSNTSEFSACRQEGVSSADMSISKSDSADPVTAGNNLTYTLSVDNAGPSDAQGVVVSDTLPSGTSFVSASDSGSYDSNTGKVTWNLGTFTESQAAKQLTLVVKVNSSRTTGLSNTASVSTTTTDPTSSNDSDTEATAVTTSADIAVAQSDSPDPVHVAQKETYTVTVTNNGPSDATGVMFSDSLPRQAGFGSVTATQGSCTAKPSKHTVSCSLGNLASGASATITIVVKPTQRGTITNTGSATATQSDPNSSNNSSSANTTVLP